MKVAFSGDTVIVVVAVTGVDEPALAEDDVGAELNRLRLTVPYEVELNLSVSGIAVGDCCMAVNKMGMRSVQVFIV